ncbi:MAG TPA: 3-methyl-2-oxobutanoate dehydrogenase (2-methylpropanoyl-transferring) subunit alpha, partial [Candidatus Poseidoniales archaeon]
MAEREKATESPFTVGTAPFRPGDKPNLGGVWDAQPKDLWRPDPEKCLTEDTHAHATGLIRVLTDDYKAEGEWNPQLSSDALIEGLKHMVTLRVFDDRMIKMQRTGKLSFYMRSFGEEAVAVAQTMALEDQDWIFPSYRQPGAQFVRGRDMVSMICHCIG